ncbi:MAG TPA: hypothetical protein PKH69_12350 [Thiobacillaceae bacterium]|nr:hypothetical protein [Thiobacillaceae bacterium]HNU65301.1 hypothetical protein [Thiobacillaceae bacterium]
MKFLWPWLAALVVVSARADGLYVDGMRLYPEPTWQRGDPEQEAEDDSLLLTWPVPEGVSLRVMVPRSPPLLKSDAGTFHRNLARKWIAQFGKAARIGWLEIGGRRWQSCRHPSRSGEGVAYQVVTVHAGRAYSVLAIVSTDAERLPGVVHELLAGVEFPAPEPAWRQTLNLAILPRGETLQTLVRAEAEALGARGMLLGHEVDSRDVGGMRTLRWSLDGFRWDVSAGPDGRRPFELRGRLAARAPAAPDRGVLRLELGAQAGESPLRVQVSRYAYCGPAAPWREALAALRREDGADLHRLARAYPCAGAGPALLASMEAAPGQTLHQDVPLPALPAQATACWLELRPVSRGDGLGVMLLEHVGLYVVYEPEAPVT